MDLNLQKQELIDMVNNNYNLSTLLVKYKEFILNVLNTYSKDIPLLRKQEVIDYMINFIKLSIDKGYINPNKFKTCFINIIETTKKIVPKDNEHRTDLGNINYKYLTMLDFNLDSSLLKHTIFHEMSHMITDIPIQNKGVLYDKKINIKNKTINNRTDDSKTIKINNRTDDSVPIPIIDDSFGEFLKEIMAESTACDLLNDYRRTKTTFAYNFESDWVVPYNKDYQVLGYEFLKTLNLSSNDEREMFKEFTIKCINSDGLIFGEILDIYGTYEKENWKKDLHVITSSLGKIVRRNYDESKINEARALMNEYSKSIRFRRH